MNRRQLFLFLTSAGIASVEQYGMAAASEIRRRKQPHGVQIVVLKGSRTLLLLDDGEVLKSYPIALGLHPDGPKMHRGDGRTPEGVYTVVGRKAHSRFHRALRLSYPNAVDLARAAAQGADPGGDIMIHGTPDTYGPYDRVRFLWDWTDGCIAVNNSAIEEIWTMVGDGTPVDIRA